MIPEKAGFMKCWEKLAYRYRKESTAPGLNVNSEPSTPGPEGHFEFCVPQSIGIGVSAESAPPVTSHLLPPGPVHSQFCLVIGSAVVRSVVSPLTPEFSFTDPFVLPFPAERDLQVQVERGGQAPAPFEQGTGPSTSR